MVLERGHFERERESRESGAQSGAQGGREEGGGGKQDRRDVRGVCVSIREESFQSNENEKEEEIVTREPCDETCNTPLPYF